MAVLDSFHFDLSLSEGVEAVQVGKTSTKNEPTPSGNPAEDKAGEETKSEGAKTSSESDDDEDDDDDEDAVGDDDEKEVEDDDDINEDEEKEVDKRKGQVAMATKIHRIIVASILPKLHKTLTKKVLALKFFVFRICVLF